jgi:hypothetical protein
VSAQKLGQPQPFMAVFPQLECAGQLASFCSRRPDAVLAVPVQFFAAAAAAGESAIKCPSPLSVLKDTYDQSCY